MDTDLTTTKLASDFLELFFNQLDTRGVNYVVLRNAEGLPYHNNSKDIDLLFSPKEILDAKRLVFEIAEELEYKCIWKNPLDYLYGLVLVKQVDDVIYSVKLDLFNGLIWRGFSYCKVDEILAKRVNYNVLIPERLDEAVIMICYYSLYAKRIRVKYRERLIEATSSDNFPMRFMELTGLSWEHNALRSEEDWQRLCNQIRNRLRVKFLLSINQFGRFFRSCWLEYVSRFNFGAFAAISGFDGCGKSSLIDPLNAELFSLGIVDKEIPDHFLSSKILAPHQLFNKTKQKTELSYNKPYSTGEVGLLSSSIRIVYYLFAFLADRILRLKRNRRNTIVIYDRYVLDFLVDLSRFRIKRIPIFSKLFQFFISNNHIKIIVLVDPQISVIRKNELSLDKAETLFDLYIESSKRYPNTILFFNKAEIKTSRMMFNDIVFDALEKHYEKY